MDSRYNNPITVLMLLKRLSSITSIIIKQNVWWQSTIYSIQKNTIFFSKRPYIKMYLKLKLL